MKKTKNYLKYVLLLATTAVLLTSCSSQPSGEVKEQIYTAASSDVSEINLSVKDRAIEILPSTDGEIHITYFENNKEFYELDLDENKVLTMQSASDKELGDFFGLSGDSMSAIKLELPSPLPCNLVISSTKNDIKLPEIVVEGNLAVEINDGTISLDKISAQGDIALNAKNGNITGSLTGNYEDFIIEAKAHKGESNLPESKTDGMKKLDANTNNGNIEIAFTGSK